MSDFFGSDSCECDYCQRDNHPRWEKIIKELEEQRDGILKNYESLRHDFAEQSKELASHYNLKLLNIELEIKVKELEARLHTAALLDSFDWD